MVKPLSGDAQAILVLIRKYPGIEGKHIGRELGITLERVMKDTMELYENSLIRTESIFVQENVYSDRYEVVKFYAQH